MNIFLKSKCFNSFEIFYPILVNPLSPDQDKERQVSSLSIVCEYIINVYKTYLSGFVDFILCKGCICGSDFSDFHFTSLKHSDLHFILNGVYSPIVKNKSILRETNLHLIIGNSATIARSSS